MTFSHDEWENTMYPSLTIGARRRLEYFKAKAANGKWARPLTWRDVRFSNLASPGPLNRGTQDGAPIWYTHDGEQFRNERFADNVARINHTGWFCDEFQDSSARGIVASLPHGKFIAGYFWSDNGERCYYPEIFTDEQDAAGMADEHARVFAESAMEDSIKFNAARELEDENEESLIRLRECLVLRNRPCMEYVRDEIREIAESIRTARDRLNTEFLAYR